MNYPGNPIAQGAKGAAVSAIQQQLNTNNYGPLTVDGDYGPATLAAVTAFQTAGNLPADGVVNEDTWNALFPPSQHTINREHFFEVVREPLFKGSLKQSQTDGINGILDEWEANYNTNDDRFLAYMLATTFHETAFTMKPIAEYGKGAGHPYGEPDAETGQTYYGRGFVQLTWKANYATFGKLLNVDLVNNPDLAMDLKNATEIMFTGMLQGLFTGKKLATYFTADNSDWVNARKIINGLDQASAIAGYGTTFYSAISYIASPAQ
jgi:putative peptidoglycan binding protein/glycosyl hydrolase family 19 (putative chitinase)